MSLQQKVRDDLKEAMKSKDSSRTSALRVLIGEFGRQAEKDISDKDVLGIIRKLVKSEMEILERSGEKTSDYLEILDGYLPKQATEDEIRAWISANINMDEFNNKMQAMKPIMAHFGGAADGNMVRGILDGME